jgi:hypothetical protein
MVAFSLPSAANASASSRSKRVPTMERRSVYPFRTSSKIEAGNSPALAPVLELEISRMTSGSPNFSTTAAFMVFVFGTTRLFSKFANHRVYEPVSTTMSVRRVASSFDHPAPIFAFRLVHF